MSNPDPDRIYLQPDCCTDYLGEGRHWCQDNVWPTSPDCDKSGVEYVRADLRPTAEIELMAETIWRAELMRATGKPRSIPWAEVSPYDQNKYRYLARAVCVALGYPLPVAQCPHGEPLNTCADCKREHLEATR